MLIRKDLLDNMLNIVSEYLNSQDEKEGKWITVKGTHIFVEDGQSEKDAISKKFAEKIKIKSIKEKLNLKNNILPNKLPEGFYVSGRKTENFESQNTTLMMFSQSYDVAEFYKGKKEGSTWIITANNKTNIKNANDENLQKTVIKDLLEDYEDGILDIEIDDLINFYDNAEEGINEIIEKGFNPDNIVDSAGFWDNPALAAWFQNRYENIDMLETNNGALVFNPDNILKQKYEYDKTDNEYKLT